MENLDSLLNLNRSKKQTSLLSNIYEVQKGGFESSEEGLNSYPLLDYYRQTGRRY